MYHLCLSEPKWLSIRFNLPYSLKANRKITSNFHEGFATTLKKSIISLGVSINDQENDNFLDGL